MTTIQQLPAHPAVADQAPAVARSFTAPAASPLLGPADPGSAIPVMGAAGAGAAIALLGPADRGSVAPVMGCTAGATIALLGPADPGSTPLMSPAR